ncbi:MAG: DUF4153 domain-containing protein [Rhizobiaceae bacterium]
MTDTPDGWKTVLAEMLTGARQAVWRFPVTAMALLLLALDANASIARLAWVRDIGWHLSLGLLAAAMASLAASLWCEARGRPAGFALIASAVAAVLAGLMVWYADQTRAYEFVILPALAGLVVIAPYLWRGSAGTFWLFAVRFVFALVLGGLALLLAAGGISAVLLSLSYLFGLDVPDDLYGYVWATTGLFLAPLFGLGRIPQAFDEQAVADDGRYMAVGMRALGDFVAAPLLIVYALILHAYAVKVIVSGEVPKNQIGWLVLGYGFCVFGALLVSAPFWSVARAPMRLLLRLWPFVMPVPLALLFYAAWLRIDQYGITPERYLLVLFGLVTSAIVLLQLIRLLRGDIRVIVTLPVLALCLASFGPQGVVGLSIKSQAKRFFDIMAGKPLDAAGEAAAVSALRFLSYHNGLDTVAPEGVELVDAPRWNRYSHENLKLVAEAYGLNPDAYSDFGNRLAFYRHFQMSDALEIGGFDLVQPQVHLYDNANARRMIKLAGGEMEIVLSGGEIAVSWREQEHRFAIAETEVNRVADAPNETPPAIDLQSGERRLRLIVQNANGERQPVPKITNMTFTLLLRSSDWQ